MNKQAKGKKQKIAVDMPYKRTPMSLPVVEDTETAEAVFGGGTTGGKYNMILVAARRAYDLQRGAPAMIDPGSHKATVIANLEIEAGLLTRDYVPKFTKPKAKDHQR